MPYQLGKIAELICARLNGDPDRTVHSITTLDRATDRDISFFSNRRYAQELKNTCAAAVILREEDIKDCPADTLVVDDPYLGFARVSRLMNPDPVVDPHVSSTATIHPSAQIKSDSHIGNHVDIGENSVIGNNAIIGSGCVIGSNTVIGNNARLYPNVVINSGVRIGNDVILHAGVVIGADGFGIANDNGRWLKIPQVGSVIIGDDVEIGANTTVDRGALGDTIIESGVKIDNQVQIGHNVRIGEHTAIAGCTAVAGSTVIGKRCMIGGACGISGHIEICDDVILLAMTGVANSIRDSGTYASGVPAVDVRSWRRNIITYKHLYEMNSKIRKIEEKLK